MQNLTKIHKYLRHWRRKFFIGSILVIEGLEPCHTHVFKKGAFFTVPWVWGFTAVSVRVVHPKIAAWVSARGNFFGGECKELFALVGWSVLGVCCKRGRGYSARGLF